MKNKKRWIVGIVFAVILVAVPLTEKYVLQMSLRPVPGAQIQSQVTEAPVETALPESLPTSPADYVDITITADYGYYPDDKWTEEKCGFYVTAPAAGELVLDIYYPFDITGTQVGHIYLDGQFYLDFVISAENQEVSIPCEEGQHYIQVVNEFAREPGAEDKRALAFVLSEIKWSAGKQGAESN